MPSPLYIISSFLIASLFMASRECSAVRSPSVDQDAKKCVNEYVMGFADPKYAKLDDLKLHCLLDSKLARCVNRNLNKYSGATFRSLAKATLSYVVFEKKLKVCSLYRYKSLLRKLNRGKCHVTKDWKKKISRLVHPEGKIPTCAKALDTKCVKMYAQRMRKDLNLCANIPFKSRCLLQGNGSCKAKIVRDLLGVFPSEATKVLAAFCPQAQDSG